MGKIYRILLDTPDRKGISTGHGYITKEGALIIWSAYEKLFGKHCQKMETRESRGGVCWLSEIDYFKSMNALPQDFNWKKYEYNPNLNTDGVKDAPPVK